jgi:Na+(H+)/acetate symporter ActP
MQTFIWIVIVLSVVAANLPFVNERWLAVLPNKAPPKSLVARLGELLVFYALVIALGRGLEAQLGQMAPQKWEFYVVTFSLFLTLASPGFVWRYLLRRSSADPA